MLPPLLQVPNGDLTSEQLTWLGDCIAPYGEEGCGDITTRANAQLRGITLAEADKIAQGMVEHGLSRYPYHLASTCGKLGLGICVQLT